MLAIGCAVPTPVFVTSRRRLLGIAVGVSAAAVAPALAQAAALAPDPTSTKSDGAKFYPDGQVRPFAGNTVVCHLPQQGADSEAFGAMLDIYREAPWRSYANRIAFLPTSSYHMTIIGGATDTGREQGKWPAGIPLDAPIGECNRIVGERIRSARLERLCTLRMKVDYADSGYDGNTIRIPLEPFDAGEFQQIEALRASLAKAIGLPAPEPGSYQFHMTLGYMLSPPEPGERQAILADLATWKARMTAAAPVIRFGTPEYCTFKDMFAFERQFFVGQAV